jgi:hypothetical protein
MTQLIQRDHLQILKERKIENQQTNVHSLKVSKQSL